MKISKEALIQLLKNIADLVEKNDSFEGSLQYSCMGEDLHEGEFEVTAAVRHGNRDGQGSIILIPEKWLGRKTSDE